MRPLLKFGISLLLLLIFPLSPLFADGPALSEPVTHYSTRMESVGIEDLVGEDSIPVLVHQLESVQTTILTGSEQANTKSLANEDVVVGNTVVTLWRFLNWYRHQDLWHVWTKARTQTDRCVQKVGARAIHQYKRNGMWVSFDIDGYKENASCKDSGVAESGKGFYLAGTEHRTRGIHSVTIAGQSYSWDERGPDSRGVA